MDTNFGCDPEVFIVDKETGAVLPPAAMLADYGIMFEALDTPKKVIISGGDWKIIEDPTEIVKIGDRVQAKIIDISNDKVSLSLKALKNDPWQKVEKKYKKGDVISGKVTKFNPFGAFVQITPEIQGLCHISEFETKTKMEENLKVGKKYDFQILEIRSEEHRMSLKLVEK